CITLRPPLPTLFPYTTLFRSDRRVLDQVVAAEDDVAAEVLAEHPAVVDGLEVLLPQPGRDVLQVLEGVARLAGLVERLLVHVGADRKSTRLNSSHDQISYAVF